MRRATLRVMVGVALLLTLTPAVRAASEFTFQLPRGWVNVLDPSFVADKVPQTVMQEAASGKYVIYAIDPDGATAESVNASFNVIEQPTTGRITEAMLKQTGQEMSTGAARLGAIISVTDTHVAKLGSVDVGVITSTMTTDRGSMRLLQYLIPGKSHAAVLTYGARPDLFDRYRTAFETSAMGTTGAYGHSGINWTRAMMFGGLGALISVVLGVMNATKKPKVAPMARPRTAAGTTSLAWDCATCKRRVPLRMEQCRCGALRPA